MSKKDLRRFGSPYDPKFTGSGKIEKPQERHSLRGCGDPNCASCNPETAAMNLPSRRDRNVPFVINTSGMGDLADSFRRMEEVIRAAGGAGRLFGSGGEIQMIRYDDEGKEVPRPKTPPASYRAAREAVKDWLAPAPDVAFEDIIGNEEALALLRDALVAPVQHKDLYEGYGMKAPKGALLSGPPGCGKTMFAKAAVSEMKKLYGGVTEFISIAGSEIQSPYVGVTEGYIKAIFTYAREYQTFHGHPLLVFIDEAEVLLPDRTGRVRRVAPWEESQVAAFLAEMDGMRENGAFVMLATNRPEVIDSAVLRDGRCDFKITVKRPTMDALAVILKRGFTGFPVAPGETIDGLAFAALESFRDPHKVLMSFRALEINAQQQRVRDLGGRDFLLEHIVSGAMAASVPGRAKRYAFARDKATGVMTGVSVADVIRSVNDLFEENRKLDHGYAVQEFVEAHAKAISEEPKRKMN